MKIRFGVPALMVIMVLSVGLAAASTIQVRFIDEQGHALVGHNASRVTLTGRMLQKYAMGPGESIYHVNASTGDKLLFQVEAPSGLVRVEARVPASLMGTLDIQLPASTGVLETSSGFLSLSSNALQAPDNDLCDAAVPVGVPSTTSGTTLDADIDLGTADCGTAITSPGVWYSFTGTGGPVTVSTCDDAAYDTKLSVYCLGCAEKTCVGGNDDGPGCSDYTSELTVSTQAGFDYLVLVHGFDGESGDFNLTVGEGGVPDFDAVQCAPTGACCNCDAPGFNCTVTTQAECAAAGREWKPDSPTCIKSVGMPASYTSTPGMPISDVSPALDTITLPGSFPVGDVNVELQIDHTWIGDLTVTLAHNGVEQVLWAEQCASTQNINATADDSGTETLCSVVAAGPSNAVFFSPEVAGLGPLSVFNGLDGGGDWTLTISDSFSLDDGILQSWSLSVDPGVFTCPDQSNDNCFVCREGVDGEGEGGEEEGEGEGLALQPGKARHVIQDRPRR